MIKAFIGNFWGRVLLITTMEIVGVALVLSLLHMAGYRPFTGGTDESTGLSSTLSFIPFYWWGETLRSVIAFPLIAVFLGIAAYLQKRGFGNPPLVYAACIGICFVILLLSQKNPYYQYRLGAYLAVFLVGFAVGFAVENLNAWSLNERH